MPNEHPSLLRAARRQWSTFADRCDSAGVRDPAALATLRALVGHGAAVAAAGTKEQGDSAYLNGAEAAALGPWVAELWRALPLDVRRDADAIARQLAAGAAAARQDEVTVPFHPPLSLGGAKQGARGRAAEEGGDSPRGALRAVTIATEIDGDELGLPSVVASLLGPEREGSLAAAIESGLRLVEEHPALLLRGRLVLRVWVDPAGPAGAADDWAEVVSPWMSVERLRALVGASFPLGAQRETETLAEEPTAMDGGGAVVTERVGSESTGGERAPASRTRARFAVAAAPRAVADEPVRLDALDPRLRVLLAQALTRASALPYGVPADRTLEFASAQEVARFLLAMLLVRPVGSLAFSLEHLERHRELDLRWRLRLSAKGGQGALLQRSHDDLGTYLWLLGEAQLELYRAFRRLDPERGIREYLKRIADCAVLRGAYREKFPSSWPREGLRELLPDVVGALERNMQSARLLGAHLDRILLQGYLLPEHQALLRLLRGESLVDYVTQRVASAWAMLGGSPTGDAWRSFLNEHLRKAQCFEWGLDDAVREGDPEEIEWLRGLGSDLLKRSLEALNLTAHATPDPSNGGRAKLDPKQRRDRVLELLARPGGSRCLEELNRAELLALVQALGFPHNRPRGTVKELVLALLYPE